MKFFNDSINTEPLVKGNNLDAGTDIRSNENVIIMPLERALIGTGVRLVGEPGKYVRIADRSGVAWKYGLHVMGGVIDSEYRGEVKVILFNTTKDPFVIEIGDKIAQLIIESCDTTGFDEVDQIDFNTSRGENGFNSSGFK